MLLSSGGFRNIFLLCSIFRSWNKTSSDLRCSVILFCVFLSKHSFTRILSPVCLLSSTPAGPVKSFRPNVGIVIVGALRDLHVQVREDCLADGELDAVACQLPALSMTCAAGSSRTEQQFPAGPTEVARIQHQDGVGHLVEQDPRVVAETALARQTIRKEHACLRLV